MTQLQNSAFKMQMSTVPFVGDIIPEQGAMIVSEHDGRIYYADQFGWHLADSDYNALYWFINFDGTTQSFLFLKFPSTVTLTFDWGDGTIENIVGQDGTFIYPTSTYSEAGDYTLIITGQLDTITSFGIDDGGRFISGSINQMRVVTALIYLGVTSAPKIYGDLKYLDNLTDSEIYMINLPFFTGDIAFANNTKNIQIENCPKTIFSRVVSFPARDGTVNIRDNGWPSSMVDNAINSIGEQNGNWVLILDSPMTDNSRDGAIGIIEAGSALIVRETNPIYDLGPELLTIASAVSDPAGNEEDSTDGWTAINLGSPNVFASVTNSAVGVYAFKTDSNPNPTANADINIGVTVEAGKVARTSFDAKHIGKGGRWNPRIDNGVINFYVTPENTKYQPYVMYHKPAGTTETIQFRERTPENDGGIFIDNVSVRQEL